MALPSNLLVTVVNEQTANLLLVQMGVRMTFSTFVTEKINAGYVSLYILKEYTFISMSQSNIHNMRGGK